MLTWQNPEAGSWLTTFAVSGVAMHGAFLLLCVLVWLQYPSGLYGDAACTIIKIVRT